MTLNREVKFHPKREGWNSNRVEFLLHGQQGTIQFVFMLDLDRASVRDNYYTNYAIDVGYHWDKKQYKGQTKFDTCEVREQNKCWYDGSGLKADEWYKVLCEQGSEAIWSLMEQYYAAMIAKAE